MSLLDKIIGAGPDGARINNHGFQAAMSEWADGASGFNRTSIIAAFGLVTEDEAELDSLKSIYDSANTDAKKRRLLKVFDNICMLAGDNELGWYQTKAEVNARLTQVVS